MTTYDEVPYPVLSHSQTHPAALAAISILHGLTPPPVATARVLEVGCASGGNLIPMACGLPEGRFVGVDYSARQIAEGQQSIDTLGLKNVRLTALNLLDADDSFGEFDYIIAHGFYSWVPQPVREKLLEVIRRSLSHTGIAYISYNAYPGWKALSATRDILVYHTRRIPDLMEKASEARSFLNFLVELMSAAKTVSSNVAYAHADFLKSVVDKLERGEDAYLLHDILEETNEPMYFHAFMARAHRHELQFVCDSDFRPALASNLPPNVAALLSQLNLDRIEWEQYTDFLSNRMFRQTLLCHAGVSLGGALTADTLRMFLIASAARPEETEPSASVRQFVGADGAKFSTESSPLASRLSVSRRNLAARPHLRRTFRPRPRPTQPSRAGRRLRCPRRADSGHHPAQVVHVQRAPHRTHHSHGSLRYRGERKTRRQPMGAASSRTLSIRHQRAARARAARRISVVYHSAPRRKPRC
ncbi:MAG: methyltransferase [Chloroflexi bacterium]|nr:methyltransferase [Chloroflexota bacterium]